MDAAQLLEVPIDFDLITGKVSIPGLALGPAVLQENLATQGDEAAGVPESKAVLPVKLGDRFPMAVGFMKELASQGAVLKELNVAVKEYDTEKAFALNTGTDMVEVSGDTGPRYRTIISLDRAKLKNVVASYANIAGTYVPMLAEIEAVLEFAPDLYTGNDVESFLIAGGAEVLKTLEIPITTPEETEYELTVVLSVPAQTRQNCSVVATMTIEKVGGVFEVSSIAGDLTDSQVGSGGNTGINLPIWNTGLSVNITGSATGITLAVTVETPTLTYWHASVTEEPVEYWKFELDLANWHWEGKNIKPNVAGSPVTETFKLYEAGGSHIVDFSLEASDDGDLYSQLQSKLHDLIRAARPAWYPTTTFNSPLIYTGGSTSRMHIYFREANPQVAKFTKGTAEFPVRNEDGPTETVTVTASLSKTADQYEEIETEDLVRTSQTFVLRLERDLHE